MLTQHKSIDTQQIHIFRPILFVLHHPPAWECAIEVLVVGTPFQTVRSFVALKEQLKQSDSGVTWGQF